MNAERQQAIQYVRAPADGFWRWAENGGVITWRDGTTIAFKEEIVQILEWLGPNGLPPFGSIVFLLAATRGKLPDAAELVPASKGELPSTVLAAAKKQLRAQIQQARAELAQVQGLPGDLLTGIKARCVLAEAAFESARAERHVRAEAILRGLHERMSDADLTDERSGANSNYIRQIHIVSEGLKFHTAETLTLRLRTGLDALPKETDATLPVSERARRLIDELSRDDEFGAVARAARELMAAVRLPRRLGEREQLAIGGVADITNRGPLDRLLLSELAHDDLTLAVRVALNEALYLRREPPMREPPNALAILLDTGVRLWGAPRALATAVALALVARDKQNSQFAAWRATGRKLQRIDLLSRAGLTEHLSGLATDPHPGEALATFNETIAGGPETQSVLITHRDTLADPDFRRALAANPDAPMFVAAVDRDGHFELHATPLGNRQPLCQADINIAEIFATSVTQAPVKRGLNPNLPAVFGVQPFPFLLPIAGKIDAWTHASGFTYATLNDRRLIQFRDQRKGARELANDLPGGKTAWIDVLEDGTVHVIKTGGSQRPVRLISRAPNSPLRVTDLVTGSELRAVHRDGDVVLLIRDNDVRAYALADGSLLGRAPATYRWIHGRYFRGDTQLHFVLWAGDHVKFEPVTMPQRISAADVLLAFDRAGMEGPWLLLKSRHVMSTATNEQIALPVQWSFERFISHSDVARDGHQLYVASTTREDQTHMSGRLLNLKDSTVTCGPSARTMFDPPPRLPSWNVFRVIEAIAKCGDDLAICGRKHRWRRLKLVDNRLRLTDILTTADESQLRDRVPFRLHTMPANTGCTFVIAEFARGSKAFLDSRGLLHLKSRDPAVPEVSLVLSDGEVAAWNSNGVVCGPDFFFEQPGTGDPSTIFQNIIQFLAME